MVLPEMKMTCYHDKRYQDVLTVVCITPHNSFKINEAKLNRAEMRNGEIYNYIWRFQYSFLSK